MHQQAGNSLPPQNGGPSPENNDPNTVYQSGHQPPSHQPSGHQTPGGSPQQYDQAASQWGQQPAQSNAAQYGHNAQLGQHPQYAPQPHDGQQAPNGQQMPYGQQPQYAPQSPYGQQPQYGQQPYYAPQPQPQPQPQPPKSNQQGLFIGLAIAVVALIVGAIALITLRGGDDDVASPTNTVAESPSASDPASADVVEGGGGSPAAPEAARSFSLVEAAQAATETNAIAFTMTMTGVESITMDAQMDLTTNMATMEVTVSGQQISMIIDQNNATIYMKSPVFQGTFPTEWVSMDMSDMTDMGADTPVTGNPLDVAPIFETATDVTEVGMETVNGREMKHYMVTVSLDEIEAQVPDYADEVNGVLPDEIVYDVYVTEDNTVGRMSFDLEDVAGEPMSTVVDFEPLDSIEPIAVPSPDQVTSIDEMMGSMTG